MQGSCRLLISLVSQAITATLDWMARLLRLSRHAAFQQQGGPCLLVVQQGILGAGGDDASILDDVL